MRCAFLQATSIMEMGAGRQPGHEGGGAERLCRPAEEGELIASGGAALAVRVSGLGCAASVSKGSEGVTSGDRMIDAIDRRAKGPQQGKIHVF